MMDSRLDIVIVNWNAGTRLARCLDSIKKAGCEALSRVVVVDNNSSDGSLDGLERIGLPLEVIRNADNRGFATACNQGAAAVTAPYILFLNPDTELFSDSLSIPLAFMEAKENQHVGICGIQLLDEGHRVSRTCARFPTLGRIAMAAAGLNRFTPFRAAGVHMGDWDHLQTRSVDHVIGAFFFLRRALFESLGGFDERFFVYLEDLDFSYRARQAGWESVYLTEARAFHEGGGTSRQVKARRLFFSLRSRILYMAKHFGSATALLGLLLTCGCEPISRAVLALGRCSFTGLRETLGAYGMLYCWLPRWVLRGVTR